MEDTRFQFGKNWLSFLATIDDLRIGHAAEKLSLLVGDIRGKSFLDVGCGSGIQSLAALRLGAARVHSFDYDSQSVECSRELKLRFAPNSDWLIERGSALDENYLRSLGLFDVVYSWGVLHHTGDMWKALDLITIPAKGLIALALYNDQGLPSRFWRAFKRLYNQSSAPARRAFELYAFFWLSGKGFLVHPRRSATMWREYHKQRGMSAWHDVIDWAGGYPFEVAKPDQVIVFFRSRQWQLERVVIHHPRACNEFVFIGPTATANIRA